VAASPRSKVQKSDVTPSFIKTIFCTYLTMRRFNLGLSVEPTATAVESREHPKLPIPMSASHPEEKRPGRKMHPETGFDRREKAQKAQNEGPVAVGLGSPEGYGKLAGDNIPGQQWRNDVAPRQGRWNFTRIVQGSSGSAAQPGRKIRCSMFLVRFTVHREHELGGRECAAPHPHIAVPRAQRRTATGVNTKIRFKE
jgi:hypothetical protein